MLLKLCRKLAFQQYHASIILMFDEEARDHGGRES